MLNTFDDEHIEKNVSSEVKPSEVQGLSSRTARNSASSHARGSQAEALDSAYLSVPLSELHK